jgi:hypothetical protein
MSHVSSNLPIRGNPLDTPERRALLREAALIQQLLGSGVTALGRANYVKTGEYYTAFFGLSIGLERLAKLILVADCVISNSGMLPKQKDVRKYRHNLIQLIDTADQLAQKHRLSLDYPRPATVISAKIIECLDAFADASRGPYANFTTLGDPNLGHQEPIQQWWGKVAELILRDRYYGKDAQDRAETQAKLVEEMISPAAVMYVNETGGAMRDVPSASIRSAQDSVVQQYGRYYALTIVRWLAEVFSKLASEACYAHNEAFSGVWEYFRTFTLDDRILKRHKIWPIKGV